MLTMIINPNEILRKKALTVSDFSNVKIQALIPQMIEKMKEQKGVGLAAPQIGESIRLFVVGHQGKELVFINPVITKSSLIKEWGEEGCLSIPHKFGEVKRHKRVTVEFLNANGQKMTIKAHGLLARIIQHELDHLNGILFIDKCRNLTTVN